MNTLLKTKRDKEEFLLWVDFLLAEVFPQGFGRLDDGDGYCCLGVGCVVLTPEDHLEAYRASDNTIVGGLPNLQNRAPRWLKDINSDYREKTGVALYLRNDYNRWSHRRIGENLLRVYKKELSAIKD